MIGRAIGIILIPQVLELAATVCGIVTFFSGYQHAYGLHNLHYMTLDFSHMKFGNYDLSSYVSQANLSQVYTVGTNGYCYGSSKTNITGCSTPTEPYWFNLDQIMNDSTLKSIYDEIEVPTELESYNDIAHKVSLASWWCWVAAIVFSGLAFVVGFIAICSRGGACCTMLLSALAVVASIIAAGLSTGLYRVYSSKFNDVAGVFGVDATLDASGLVIAWATVILNAAAGMIWALVACCCGSPRSSRDVRYVKTENDEPYMGYIPERY